MKIKSVYLFSLIAILIILGTFVSIIKLTPSLSAFNSGNIVSFRKAKNQILSQRVDGPFYKDLSFDSLQYYLPNEKEIFRSDVYEVVDGEELDLMPDRVGYPSHKVVSFLILERETWRDTLFVLKDFEEKSDTTFFAPFLDGGNGKESYGGGRYLDLTILPGKQAVVDFNYAYNPYCAYNSAFLCPKVPGMNRLSRIIGAGEKNYISRLK